MASDTKIDKNLYAKIAGMVSDNAQQQGAAGSQSMLSNTTDLNKLMLGLATSGTKKLTKQGYELESTYAPQYAALYQGILDENDPYFSQVRGKLGEMTMNDLSAGRELGPELSRELEQDIRKGQDARGNWYGPAPTADEAFRKASARETLYQQRVANAGNFLQTRSPSDMWGNIKGATQATRTYSPVAAPSTVPQYSPMGSVSASLYSPVNYSAAGSGGGWSWGGAAGGALSGAASGATVGTAFGPWGTAIGAGAGGIFGAVGGGLGSN